MANVVFFGTPEFAIPILKALIEHYSVLAVVTQPDRPAGRGRRRLQAPPVKELAMAHSIPVLQPARLRRDMTLRETLAGLGADLFVLASYGQILPGSILAIPPYGCIGVHASLLPRWRGAAPVAAAIRQGDAETGITLMLTDEGMDTGPIIAQRALPIAPRDTTATLTTKLAALGADLVIETLPAWLAGGIAPQPQDESAATYAPPIRRESAAIDWTRSAVEIERQVRAYNPWPGTYCACAQRNFRILQARAWPEWRGEGLPGKVVETPKGIGVVTGQGLLLLDKVQIAGKRPMQVDAFARGQRDFIHSVLESCCSDI